MAEVDLKLGIPRLKANESRINDFANGDEATDMQTSGGTAVPSIRKLVAGWMSSVATFITDKDAEINAVTDSILSGAVAARDAALGAQGAAEVAQSGSETALFETQLARDVTVLARDAAMGAVNLFTTTSAGLAATSVGDYFSVPSASSSEFVTLYRHDAGPVATAVKTYPSSAAVELRVAYADGFNRVTTSPTGMPQIVDANGVELLGFDSTGKAIVRLGTSTLAAIFADLGGYGFHRNIIEKYPSLKDANDVELLGFDSLGRARFAVSPDIARQVLSLVELGDYYDPVGAGVLPALAGFVLGDSMSSGTVTSAISAALGGRQFDTLAKGGTTAATMAVAMGASPLLVTLSGDAIPASGGVAVTAKNQNILYSGGTYTGTANVAISGVPGVLSTDASGNWTFTRTAPGSVVAISPNTQAVLDPAVGTAFIPATSAYRNRTAILRLGRNGARDTRANRVANTLEPLRKVVDFLTPRVKHIVVVSPYNGRAKDYSSGLDHEASGTAAYVQMMTLIEEMRREFGPLFLDMRTAAVKNAIYDLGLTPTADDLADMAADCIPRQLFSSGDNTHTNSTMQGWEGTFMGNHLRALGY